MFIKGPSIGPNSLGGNRRALNSHLDFFDKMCTTPYENRVLIKPLMLNIMALTFNRENLYFVKLIEEIL